MHAVWTVLGLALSIYQWLIIIRVLLTWFPRVSAHHPLVRILRRVVDPYLNAFRRVLPTLGGLDLSPLLAILVVVEAAKIVGVIDFYTLYPALVVGSPGGLLGLALADIVRSLVNSVIILLGIIALLRVLVTFASFDPWHPAVVMIRQLSNPLVRPFQGMVGYRKELAPVLAFSFWVITYFVVDTFFRHAFPALFG